MNSREVRQIGTTELTIPVLGLGGSTLGGFGSREPTADEESQAAYAAAWACGFRYFDTAPRYGDGLGEQRLGRALQHHPRSTYTLSTKVGILRDVSLAETATSSSATAARVEYDYGYDATLRSIDRSLERLSTERLDLVFIHDIGPQTHGHDEWEARFAEAMTGAYPALARLASEGVVNAVGIGVNSCAVCIESLKAVDLDVLMLAGRYTLLNQVALDEVLPRCAAQGVSVIAAAPFSSGILATGARPGAKYDESRANAKALDKVAAIEKICTEHGVSLGAAAVQFPLTHPRVAAVAPGPRSAGQVRAVARWFEEPIPDSLWAALKDAGVLAMNVPVPGGEA